MKLLIPKQIGKIQFWTFFFEWLAASTYPKNPDPSKKWRHFEDLCVHPCDSYRFTLGGFLPGILGVFDIFVKAGHRPTYPSGLSSNVNFGLQNGRYALQQAVICFSDERPRLLGDGY